MRALRIRGILVVVVALLGVMAPAAGTVPAARAAGTTLAYIGNGTLANWQPYYRTAATAAWTVSHVTGAMGNGVLQVSITPDGSVISETFHFAAPPGEPLAVGMYADAVRWPFQGAGQAGIDIPIGCSIADGSFEILELDLDGDTVEAFAVAFHHDCEAQGVAWSDGEIRYQSSIGVRVLTGVRNTTTWEAVTGKSSTRTFTWTARGTLPTTVSSIDIRSIFGPEPVPAFQVTAETCIGTTLDPGEKCTVTVRFSPQVTGGQQMYLVLGNDTISPTVQVLGSAEGRPFSVTSQVDFGSHELQTKARRTITFSNGLEPTELGFHEITGSARFTRPSPTCEGTTVASLGSCTITIEFKPTAVGASAATFTWHAAALNYPNPMTALTGTGTSSSNVVWGTTRNGPGSYAWTAGFGLGRTISGSTTYLHAIQNTDYVSGGFTTDTARHAGAYYTRTTNEGSTWTTPTRLNPSNTHSARSTLAASGAVIYTAYVTQTKWLTYSGSAPRVLWVRVNTNHGSSTAWRAPLRITSTTGRVDYPVIAASGTTAYLTYTDSVTGNIRISVTRNGGLNWTTTTLGTTSRTTSDGREGLPAVAVRGSNVVVAWSGDASLRVRARTSADAGVTWASAVTLATTAEGYTAVAAGSDRWVVAWPGADGLRIKTRSGTTWGGVKTIAPPATDPYGWHTTPAIALSGTTGTAAAWGACTARCTTSTPSIDVVWAESRDRGLTFPHRQVLFSANQPERAAYPSILWPTADRRHVLFGWESEVNYRLRLRTGTGSPM